MKKILTMLMIALVGMSMVFAQGGSESSSADSAYAGYDVDNMDFHDVTITVASRYGTDLPHEAYFRQRLDEFREQNPGIKVIHKCIPAEAEFLDMLRTDFATGDAPNIFQEYGGSRCLDYVESDALVDLTPYFEQYPEWYNGFNKGCFEKLQYEEYPGKTWGTPYAMYVVPFYVNTELFEKAGLDYPENWDDLLYVCEEFMKQGIQPFAVGEKENWRLGHFSNNVIIKSLGIDAVYKLGNRELAYDDPAVVETFAKIKYMLDKGYMGKDPLSTSYPQEKAIFAEGGCAMRWDGSWYVGEIVGTPIYDKVKAIPFPWINEEYKLHNQGGASDSLFVSKVGQSDAEIAASVKLLKFLTNEEYFAKRNEVQNDIYPYTFTPTAETKINPLMQSVQAIADSMTAMRDDIQTYDTQSHMLDTVRSAIQGLAMGNSPEQCVKEITDRIAEYN